MRISPPWQSEIWRAPKSETSGVTVFQDLSRDVPA